MKPETLALHAGWRADDAGVGGRRVTSGAIVVAISQVLNRP